MSRRPAAVTQPDIARVIRAAKQAGAEEVEVRIGNVTILIRTAPSTPADKPLEQVEDIVL